MRQWREKLQTQSIYRMTRESNWGDYSALRDAPIDTKINTLIIQLLTLTFFAARLQRSQLPNAPSSLVSQKKEALLSYVSLEMASRTMIMFVPVKTLTAILKLLPPTSLTVEERDTAIDIFNALQDEIAHELYD